MLRQLREEIGLNPASVAAFGFLAMVIAMRGIVASGRAAVAVMLFMKLLRLFEVVAFAGKAKHTERQRDQETFHHAPSIAPRPANAIPKEKNLPLRQPLRDHPRRPRMGTQTTEFR